MLIPRINAIVSISRLEQSTAPPTVNAIRRARSIAYFLDRNQFPIPFVFPTDEHGIQFEWKGDSRELNLEVPSTDEPLTFLTIVDGNPALEDRITANIETEIRRLIDWMLSAKV